MKDRIRQLMESQHMNQQSFASFLGMSPATLSSILQERTRPTLATVELVCKKMPKVNLSWLINGEGPMFASKEQEIDAAAGHAPGDDVHGRNGEMVESSFLDAVDDPVPAAQQQSWQTPGRRVGHQVRESAATMMMNVKNIDKESRKITEIRVFYDDQTWESFVPKK